ncbi:MAG: DnaJ-class molecular chaperone [Planctomycetaceae bacterium]|jgi:DnaJ-class molecular chaperone
MPAEIDPYRVLEVSRSATRDDIRKSYKKLARKYHPDANIDAPSTLEKFKQVQVAWDILGDKEKRQNFDKYGSPDGPQFRGGPEAGGGSGTGGPGAGQPRTWPSGDGGEVPFDIEELFGGRSPFGGFGGGPGQGDWPVRGHDVRAKIEVSFTVAAEGGTYDLHLQRGSGDRPETLSVKVPAGIDTGSVV